VTARARAETSRSIFCSVLRLELGALSVIAH